MRSSTRPPTSGARAPPVIGDQPMHRLPRTHPALVDDREVRDLRLEPPPRPEVPMPLRLRPAIDDPHRDNGLNRHPNHPPARGDSQRPHSAQTPENGPLRHLVPTRTNRAEPAFQSQSGSGSNSAIYPRGVLQAGGPQFEPGTAHQERISRRAERTDVHRTDPSPRPRGPEIRSCPAALGGRRRMAGPALAVRLQSWWTLFTPESEATSRWCPSCWRSAGHGP